VPHEGQRKRIMGKAPSLAALARDRDRQDRLARVGGRPV
jgi:hypothetical protein